MRIALSALLAFLVAGCSIHPQAQDFSRQFAPEIVKKVRCEAQLALAQYEPTFSKTDRKLIVAFDFDFIMSEANDATSQGGVTIPVSLGSFSVGWSAGIEKDRKTSLKIKIEDSFADLLALSDCAGDWHRNFKYPITGEIGLRDTISNFVNLQRLRNQQAPSTFFDEIEFTTAIGGSITPKIDLAPKIGRKVTAEAKLAAARSDLHRVKLTISDPPGKPKPTKIQIVDANGNVIVPGVPGRTIMKDGDGTTGYVEPSPPDTARDRKARARDQADQIELQRTLEDIQRQLQRR